MAGYSLSSFWDISPIFPALFAGILLSLYLCYQWALPRPIPGIPYNKAATKTLLGDIGPALQHLAKHKEASSWVLGQTKKLQSPIIQLWFRPLGKPFVILTDFRECRDIMLRRTREFDRSQFFADVFSGVLPQMHLVEKTNDKWKKQRRWIQDLMTPTFLEQVAGPQIYVAFSDLIALWEEKARLAKGHPFSASNDVYRTALDAVFAFTFMAKEANSTLRAQVEFASSLEKIDVPGDLDKEVDIPEFPDPEIVQAVFKLAESLETAVQSPVPTISHWFIRMTPSYRRVYAIKERFIKNAVDNTVRKFQGNLGEEMELNCALDEMIRRENLLAEKEGRAPAFHTRAMYDEILGLVITGHETTSTTINWSLKLLADNPSVQTNLRSSIQKCYAIAYAQKRAPTIQEITKTSIHYLDAVMEELLRLGAPATATIRTAMVDASVLGHLIPKGTDIIMPINGPSFRSPSFSIDESLRSTSSRASKDQISPWDEDDMADFKPERWLVEEDGKVAFDATAGPQLAFGLGPRGCFGRKLAYLELRLALVLIVWSFELTRCPEVLSGYGATDRMTCQPQQCFVRLRKL